MRLNPFMFAIAALGGMPVYAAETAVELPEVAVSAPAPVPARTVSEINAEDIARRQPNDVKALLKNEWGVAVIQAQRTRQGNDGVNIRGLTGNRVGMGIDGIPLPEAQESRIFASSGLAFGRGLASMLLIAGIVACVAWLPQRAATTTRH